MPEAPGRVEFVHRSWPADPAQLSVIRRELSGWLAPLALSEDQTADVVLAVDEAAANAVRHAYGPGTSGVVELTLWTEPGTLCVEVVDHGNWRPPTVPEPTLDSGDSGRGIPLMSSMADAVLIHYDARGSRVLLRHRVDDAEQDGTERDDTEQDDTAEHVDDDTVDSDGVDSDGVDSDGVDSDGVDSDTVDSDTVDSDTVDSDTVENGDPHAPVAPTTG